jgi:transglutaminase-like putative cysteine protease
MKYTVLIITSLLLLTSCGCRQNPHDCSRMLKKIEAEFDAGNLLAVKKLGDSLKIICPYDKLLISKSDSLSQIAERIALDFPLTGNMIDTQLKEKNGEFTPEEKTDWEKKNWLECRTIDGEKRYFSRAVSNLGLIRSFYTERSSRDSLDAADPEIVYRKRNTQAIIKASENLHMPVLPVNMTINYTITVDADAVPAGETVRCWLPYPKENQPRQKNVRLLSTSNKDLTIAPDSAIHKTIYMESRAVKGVPVVFKISYSYQSSGQYFDPDKMKIKTYDKSSTFYKEFISEELPHICFTEKVKHLADSIAAIEENPFEIVRKIYAWFTENIPWAGAQEYSIIPNIPEYVLKNRRGDCGMQTFLFMSMLRYKGIPVRWQSGWKVPPDAKNLHDWSEVYFEGIGWVPVDISYGLQYSNDKKTREFYISGIDSYRLIINEGVAGRLYPEKKFLRSEPFDFQRGEVEWRGGNLYFDKWDYDMEIIYNK